MRHRSILAVTIGLLGLGLLAPSAAEAGDFALRTRPIMARVPGEGRAFRFAQRADRVHHIAPGKELLSGGLRAVGDHDGVFVHREGKAGLRTWFFSHIGPPNFKFTPKD